MLGGHTNRLAYYCRCAGCSALREQCGLPAEAPDEKEDDMSEARLPETAEEWRAHLEQHADALSEEDKANLRRKIEQLEKEEAEAIRVGESE